ncbi:aquaporin-like protein [Neofusicoccum parvum]|uniref:Aquaporin-like protein n=1 Tax=Neofusicoccum parvum TaxID=310453 RepID=A0ACB5RU83_9PEZI|nr:aquaporin-like protein [Neofusicoccum parvum]
MPTHSLGKDLPQPKTRKQERKPSRKPQRKATVESPEETEARARQDTQLPHEKPVATNLASTEGRAPLAEDGQPQNNFNPFASFDRIGRSFDGEEGEQLDNTEWAIDAEPIGRSEKEEAETGEKDPNELRNWWARIRAKHPEPLAEFLCTTISIFLGMCATLQVNLAGGEYGNYETSCWAWGIAFMLGIYVGGGVSGAHMNPAISLSLWLFRGFPPKQMLIYWACQLLGCIAAAALAYTIFHDTIHHVDPGLVDTATSFYSKPQPFVGPTTAFFTQFVAAAVMMTSTLALGDDQNNPPGAGLHAFVMGLLVTAQKMTLGYNTGVALNPASDFGPRLVCLMVGYNTNMFTERGLWWLWGPWASTVAGSVVGCSVYDSLVFVGSESPVNYRLPEKWRRRLKKAAPKKEGAGMNGWGE